MKQHPAPAEFVHLFRWTDEGRPTTPYIMAMVVVDDDDMVVTVQWGT